MASPPEQDDRLVRRVVHDLEHAYEAVSVAAAQPSPDRAGLRKAVKALLLRPLHTSAAKKTRAVYYVFLALCFANITAFGWAMATDWQSLTATGDDTAATVIGALLMSVVSLTPAVLVWLLARFFERRALHRRAEADPRSQVLSNRPAPG